jgi:hypothetical protein
VESPLTSIVAISVPVVNLLVTATELTLESISVYNFLSAGRSLTYALKLISDEPSNSTEPLKSPDNVKVIGSHNLLADSTDNNVTLPLSLA